MVFRPFLSAIQGIIALYARLLTARRNYMRWAIASHHMIIVLIVLAGGGSGSYSAR